MFLSGFLESSIVARFHEHPLRGVRGACLPMIALFWAWLVPSVRGSEGAHHVGLLNINLESCQIQCWNSVNVLRLGGTRDKFPALRGLRIPIRKVGLTGSYLRRVPGFGLDRSLKGLERETIAEAVWHYDAVNVNLGLPPPWSTGGLFFLGGVPFRWGVLTFGGEHPPTSRTGI